MKMSCSLQDSFRLTRFDCMPYGGPVVLACLHGQKFAIVAWKLKQEKSCRVICCRREVFLSRTPSWQTVSFGKMYVRLLLCKATVRYYTASIQRERSGVLEL